MTRKSKATWVDCENIIRYANKLTEAVVVYAAHGLQKEGLRDDQMVMVEAITLRNKLNELIDRNA